MILCPSASTGSQVQLTTPRPLYFVFSFRFGPWKMYYKGFALYERRLVYVCGRFSTPFCLSFLICIQYSQFGFFFPIYITLHFDTLKYKFHVSVYFCILYKSSCISVCLCESSYTFVSSANTLQFTFIASGRSFINIVNNTGPKILPCGIPLNTLEISE